MCQNYFPYRNNEKNLEDGVKCLKEMLKNGTAEPSDLMIFPLDRAEGRYTREAFQKT